jgi:hypothetical protein
MTQILFGPTLTDAQTLKVTDKKTGKTYYKKQILPEGQFSYGDSDLDLGPETLKLAVESFKAGAADEVPFQWGGTQGEHNNDPQKRGGTLAEVEHVPGKGLFGYFDFSTNPETATYVEKYPKFGVSPQILLNHERPDGKKFDVMLNHVLGTSVPKMKGMSSWEKVTLSEELEALNDEEKFDFSMHIENAAPVAGVVITENKDGDGGVADKVELSEDLVNFLGRLKADQDAIDLALKGGEEQKTELPQEVSLAMQKIEAHGKELAELKAQNVIMEWQAKKAQLLRDGVPPAALDLAEPVMTKIESSTINLSTADGPATTTDKQAMLNVLEMQKGIVQFGEEGHGIGGQEPSDDSVKAEEIDAFFREYGI